MRVLIVNRFFGGAQIPTGRMAEDLARVLVEDGHEVVALASGGQYAGAVAQASDQETKRQPEVGGLRLETGDRLHGNQLTKDEKTVGGRKSEIGDHRPEVGATRSEVGGQEQEMLRVETVQVPKWMPRAIAWLWFTWQARQRIPRMHWDVCVLMTDPPLLPLLAARLKDKETKKRKDGGAKARGQDTGNREQSEVSAFARSNSGVTAKRRIAVWLMDLYPEALAASGRVARSNPLYKWFFNKRQAALASADQLICLGEAQRERLQTKRPIDQELESAAADLDSIKTAVVPPWDDRGNIALATEESLSNLALYAGNLGEAHCFEEILAAAPHLPGDWTIRFAVRGAKLSALRATVNTGHGLTRISADKSDRHAPTGRLRPPAVSSSFGLFSSQGAKVEITGYASEEETPGLLASARVHLITMSPGWEGIVVPSKLYGCIRTGRPVLFIGPENADTAREIRAHDWGKVLPPGASGEEVAAAILELTARPTRPTQTENGAKKVAELIQGLATD